ncbi:glycosyltransferase [Yasminevirus sp. GU-2018]|uniref:Glycosyltransferase n=1 Tax=Yasminevirus sp. GU-2018 TaxID=2420051 RepID=A0A5K0U9M7_9VIRU|nr:glycosyltransferase [Yasminevirus sp. GU-2018]
MTHQDGSCSKQIGSVFNSLVNPFFSRLFYNSSFKQIGTINSDHEKIRTIVADEYRQKVLLNTREAIKLQPSKDLIKVADTDKNIIITLTTVPPRIHSDALKLVLKSLFTQTLLPKYVILNVCKKYNKDYGISDDSIEERIKELMHMFPDLVINRCNDYSPATKLLGILELNEPICDIKNDDRIIVVDDDCPLNVNMTLHYELCYQLYNCDCVFINERDLLKWGGSHEFGMDFFKISNIYYDNYQNFAYGWLSFSFKKRFVTRQIVDLLENLKRHSPFIQYHDDLLFTLYYRQARLNACGMNLFFPCITEEIREHMTSGLHVETDARNKRSMLELKLLEMHNIGAIGKNDHNYIVNKKDYICNKQIQKVIKPRYLIKNVNDIDYDKRVNVHDIQVDFKHFNERHILLTLTVFNPNFNENMITLYHNGTSSQVTLEKNEFSQKLTFVIELDNSMEIDPKNEDILLNILQTHGSATNMSTNRFNSIATITSYVPWFTYSFFDDDDILKFLIDFYPRVVPLYNKLKPKAYKADLFRALYAYRFGVIYFDCKHILFRSINELFNDSKILVKDVPNEWVYNGMFCLKKCDGRLEKYIVHMLMNIHQGYYGESALAITGPELFGRYMYDVNTIKLQNTFKNDDWKNNIIYWNKSIVIKPSYYGYYNGNEDYLLSDLI